jgi:uncharacterized membrane protein YeaQ/YmgE (transglycosylase-associated protein family)
MKEVAEAVINYFQENLLATIVIAPIAGFLAMKTVAHDAKGGILLYFVVGLLGSFVGQYVLVYFGLKEFLLEHVANLSLFFDILASYFGSFVLATLVHFVKPL